jgi:hypothetical protein
MSRAERQQLGSTECLSVRADLAVTGSAGSRLDDALSLVRVRHGVMDVHTRMTLRTAVQALADELRSRDFPPERALIAMKSHVSSTDSYPRNVLADMSKWFVIQFYAV